MLAIFAALGGTAGIAAVAKVVVDGRSNAKQHDLEVLREVVNQLQEENGRLCERLEAYELEIIKERQERADLQLEFEDAKRREYLLRKTVEQNEQILSQVRAENGVLKTDLGKEQRKSRILRRELEKAQQRIAELVLKMEGLETQMNGGRGDC